MNQRQEKLFLKIVQEYIDSAEPVGSSLLASKYNFGVSAATIRNDMVDLENEGLIMHPYTSAGRIPTEKGYKLYLDNYLHKIKEINKRDKDKLNELNKEKDKEIKIKNIAKEIAHLSGSAVVVALDRNNVYYTGIANLLAQPDFADLPVIYNISEVMDHLDEVVLEIYDQVDKIEVKIGSENYFDRSCASVLVRNGEQLIMILGPVRMNYERNIGLINYLQILLG